MRRIMYGSCVVSSEQAIGDLPRCLVQKRIVRFLLALMHGLACCFYLLLVELFQSTQYHSRERVLFFRSTILMNTDANPFASDGPNTTGGTEDFEGDIDLAGAERTGSVVGGSDQGAASSQFPPPWPGLAMNPLRPTFRAETQTDPTVPPLPEGGGEATAEPEDPSAELLRRVSAGSREPDVSRVKLAKMPAPAGSRGLTPAKAWQDRFTIRLRTWLNVISPEF